MLALLTRSERECIRKPITPKAAQYVYFFPQAGCSPCAPSPKPPAALSDRFGIGWWADANCCAFKDKALGISLGYVHDHLVSGNAVQMFHYSKVAPTVCSYDIDEHRLHDIWKCRQWIVENPGVTTWIVGNEPDFLGVSLDDYVVMWHDVSAFLLSVNPNTRLIVTGWANESWDETAGRFLALYQARYGVKPHPYAWGFHQYHYAEQPVIDNEASVLRFVKGWQRDSGWGNIWLTEFGWNWADGTAPDADRIAYMREFIPWLAKQPQIGVWFWWRDSGALVGDDGTLTRIGKCYSDLAHDKECK